MATASSNEIAPSNNLLSPIAEGEIELPEMAPHRTNHRDLNDHFYVSQ
jgi:hypothetical protein